MLVHKCTEFYFLHLKFTISSLLYAIGMNYKYFPLRHLLHQLILHFTLIFCIILHFTTSLVPFTISINFYIFSWSRENILFFFVGVRRIANVCSGLHWKKENFCIVEIILIEAEIPKMYKFV